MFIPIGLDDTRLNRVPFITFGVIGLCALIHLGIYLTSENNSLEVAHEFVSYYLEHPYLELPEHLTDDTTSHPIDLSVLERVRDEMKDNPLFQTQWEKPNLTILMNEQAYLDELAEQLIQAVKRNPNTQWGFITGNPKPETLITHQFLHADFWHLLGNMLFFYLIGPFIEDKWGRSFFTVFYLVAGVFAAAMFMVHHPNLNIPLIGASGAVSGVMGAFLIKFWNRKIKFFYWFFIIVRGTVDIVAWIILPLYFLQNLLLGWLTANQEGGGVAYWAHVWGFVLGVVIAVILRKTGLEMKLNPMGLDLDDPENNPIKAAEIKRHEGKPREALAILAKAVEEHPDFMDIWHAYWEEALAQKNVAAMVKTGQKLMRNAIQTHNYPEGFYYWRQLVDHVPQVKLQHNLLMAFARGLIKENQSREAGQVLHYAHRQLQNPSPTMLAAFAELCAQIDPPFALDLARKALAGKDLPEVTARRLQQIVQDSKREPEDPFQLPEMEPKDPPEPKEHLPLAEDDLSANFSFHLPIQQIQAFTAVPQKVSAEGLWVRVKEQTKVVKFQHIKCIAVAALRKPGHKPAILVDLCFDRLDQPRDRHRVFRIASNQFQPLELFPRAASSFQAFFSLFRWLAAKSKAEILPSAEVLTGKNIADYPSVAAFENALYHTPRSP